MATQRVLSRVVHSSPISVGTGPEPHTEAGALIEVYCDKVDWKALGETLFI